MNNAMHNLWVNCTAPSCGAPAMGYLRRWDVHSISLARLTVSFATVVVTRCTTADTGHTQTKEIINNYHYLFSPHRYAPQRFARAPHKLRRACRLLR
jgi:hypothetical protein